MYIYICIYIYGIVFHPLFHLLSISICVSFSVSFVVSVPGCGGGGDCGEVQEWEWGYQPLRYGQQRPTHNQLRCVCVRVTCSMRVWAVP